MQRKVCACVRARVCVCGGGGEGELGGEAHNLNHFKSLINAWNDGEPVFPVLILFVFHVILS